VRGVHDILCKVLAQSGRPRKRLEPSVVTGAGGLLVERGKYRFS
jgi:hypothetical protein